MATTTFSGPIRSGPLKNTTGTNVQNDMANVGYAVTSQSVAVTQAATSAAPATTIIIPANSRILSIKLYVTTVWNGAASTAGLGWDDGTVVDATSITTATGVAGGTLGLISATPGANQARVQNWDNTGTNSKRIRILSVNTGTGVGTLVVDYVQAVHATLQP
jgi:hypothetical protein